MLLSILYRSVCCLLGLIAVLARQDLSKDAELLVLRRENTVLRTTHWSHVRGTTRHAASPDAAPTAVAITKVVSRRAVEDPSRGHRRVQGELIRLDPRIATCPGWQILPDAGIDPAPHRSGPDLAPVPHRPQPQPSWRWTSYPGIPCYPGGAPR
jgi:putative transposase